jgi:hypothetical protein
MDNRCIMSIYEFSKNEYMVEIIRSVVLWTVWLKINYLCFHVGVVPKNIKVLEM